MTPRDQSASGGIQVRDFTFGGSVNDMGVGVTDCSTGELNNVRVGGTAHISGNDSAGDYETNLTIRARYP